MEEKKVKIKHPNKNEITDGIIVSIKSQEPQGPCVDYILEDGSMLRVCTDITAIIKVLDEEGKPLKDVNGANVYSINYNVKFTAFNTGK